MPTSTVYSVAGQDGHIQKDSSSNWLDARNAASGTSAFPTTTDHAQGCQAQYFGGRGSTWRCKRSYFYFDTSSFSLSTNRATSATINIRGRSVYTSGDIIGVKQATISNPLATSDFEKIAGWTGASDTDQESNVTKYTDEVTTWSGSGYNTITLLPQAVSDINNFSKFQICFLNYDYDLKGVDPDGASDVSNGMYYTDYTGTSRDPYLSITYTVVTTYNSIFFGTNF